MKKILPILALLLTAFIAGCSSNDEDVDTVISDNSIYISENEVIFTAEGGEQSIEIMTTASWDYECLAEWVLVRRQDDKIRIIADSNPIGESRTAFITILSNTVNLAEIQVFQAGLDLKVEESELTAESAGGTITVPVISDSEWNFKNSNDWCTVSCIDQTLVIGVQRNYQMKERSGVIRLEAGEVEREIHLVQSGCEWYESFEMVNVEGGRFYMGAQSTDENMINYDPDAYQIEAPVHEVNLKTFALGKYEVTQEQWIAAMGNNPSYNQGDAYPVENVTWDEVQEFIALLNERTGLNYHLPTEAEWEYAAKGGVNQEGYLYSGFPAIGICAWYYSNSESSSHEVGTKDPNSLGIYDMSGNVREWCYDWFDGYPSYIQDSPQGPWFGTLKTNRGGSWTTPAVNCRNTYRFSDEPTTSSKDLGFRLALTVSE